MSKNILAFVDAPDPDNFVMIIALAKLNPRANLQVVLTGRPVRFGATREHQLWEWDIQSSKMAQQVSALRIKNFLRHFGVEFVKVYDGGIAPRTLVPHWLHFAEYYKFLDADPLQALRYSEIEPQEDLVRLILSAEEWFVAVGGPMTGLSQIIIRCPAVAARIKEIHAMYATWGQVQLMQMDDQPRGALQFNVACDPQAGHFILKGLDCPIYLMPSEVTRVRDIGFSDAQTLRELLPDNVGVRALYYLYALWYDAAIKPRQINNPSEMIFIHDFVSALSLNQELRSEIYEIVPIEIGRVPHLPNEAADWGKVFMKQIAAPGNRWAGTGIKSPGRYFKVLQEIFT